MDKETFVVRAPGKLLLLGEYAVLEEGIPAVAVAINKCIYCHIRENDKIIFTSRRIHISKVQFEYKDKKINLLSDVKEIDVLSFSKNAMEITLRYLEELGVTLKNFEINILSDLSNQYNVKYGFGSSAAVTVAIVGAILYLHGYDINKANKDIVYKLSAISHFISQGSGSGVDVAAATYGGLFIYKSYTSDWLKRKIQNLDSVSKLVKEDWKFFEVNKIMFLINFYLAIGWTGKAASTKHFLEHVKKVKFGNESDIKFYNTFLKTTEKIVEIFIDGIKNDKKDLINKAIIANRNLLKDLAKRANIEMETETLRYLIGVAKKFGLEAKFSGAGGGDCGFAVMFDKTNEKALKNEWLKYGIQPIDLEIDEFGVAEVNFLAPKKE
ncbi:MAG: phosphomevalonate kinase [Candidatus Sericytochromatia bacterium]